MVWQAEEAVANLPVRLAVRVHCGHHTCAQHRGARVPVLQWHKAERSPGCSRGTLGVLRYRGTHGTISSGQLAFAVGRMRKCTDGSVQGLELLVTVLLARNRQPPPTVAAGVPHAELAAKLVSLPSGLLAMVCEAIVALKVRLGAACACVRARVRVRLRACLCARVSASWAIGDGLQVARRVHGACQSRVGAARASTSSPTYAE